MNLTERARLVRKIHDNWWRNPKTGRKIKRNQGELIALMHSELSEALEGLRKNLMDTKLKHRKMVDVELVDCLIRILDFAGEYGIDLEVIFWEKLHFNIKRADHKLKNRAKKNGKKF